MLTTETLNLMLQVIGFIKTGSSEADLTVLFGGINVLLQQFQKTLSRRSFQIFF